MLRIDCPVNAGALPVTGNTNRRPTAAVHHESCPRVHHQVSGKPGTGISSSCSSVQLPSPWHTCSHIHGTPATPGHWQPALGRNRPDVAPQTRQRTQASAKLAPELSSRMCRCAVGARGGGPAVDQPASAAGPNFQNNKNKSPICSAEEMIDGIRTCSHNPCKCCHLPRTKKKGKK